MMELVTHKIFAVKGFNVELFHNWLTGSYTVQLDGKDVFQHQAFLDTGIDAPVYAPSGTFVCRVQAHYSWFLWRSWCYQTSDTQRPQDAVTMRTDGVVQQAVSAH